MQYDELMEAALMKMEEKGALKRYTGKGAETGYAGRYNREIFKAFGFRFRMIDAVAADTSMTLFGRQFKTPIMCAALSGMTDITDEPLAKIAKGVSEAESLMWVGITNEEQFNSVLATGAPTVRIVKPFADMEKMYGEIRQAEDGGAFAVGTDIDFFFGGTVGERMFAPAAMGPKNSEELKELISATRLPFILKGVLSAEDARRAVDLGAGGIVVSNHGAAIIDYSAHPLEVLPEIKEAVGDKIPVFADSGFLRGSDIVKALALGADAVCVGKALIMGLAANESDGVREMMEILTEEVRRIMSVTGCPDLSSVDESILVRRNLFLQED